MKKEKQIKKVEEVKVPKGLGSLLNELHDSLRGSYSSEEITKAFDCLIDAANRHKHK